jgi:hypothetical protein
VYGCYFAVVAAAHKRFPPPANVQPSLLVASSFLSSLFDY